MMKHTRILSLLLAMIMVFSLLPVSAFAAEAGTPEVVSQQLNLGDDLTMHFYVTAEENTVVNATVNGETVAHDLSKMTPDSDGQYVIAVKLAAAQMTEAITLDFLQNDVSVLQKTYSIRDYAETILAGNYPARTKNLVIRMLNYGAAAQNYFDVNIGNLANADYETEEVQLPTEYEAMAISGAVDGIRFYGASLVFENQIAVRYYFTGDSIEGVTFAANDATYSAVAKDGMFYVEVPGINPQDYANSISLTATKGEDTLTVSYSPLNYIVRMSGKDTTSDTLKALLNAMYGYHEAAIKYVSGGGFFGDAFGYTSTPNIDLTADTGANDGTVTVNNDGIAFGYIDSFKEDEFYFETKIHVNDINATEKWPKFGLFVESDGIREYLYVDMTTGLTATVVGRMTNTNNTDDWDNINTATVSNMAFSGTGETVTLGVLKDQNILHFFVDGQYTLSHQSKIDGAAVAGVFGFNTGMTLTEYFIDTTADTKEAKLALVPENAIIGFFGNTSGYTSTPHFDLTEDTGANTGTVTVNSDGIAFGYINSFSRNEFYFETKIHVNGINATENWPKFGLFIESGIIREYLYIDMTTELTATEVGRMTNTNNTDDWENINTATISNMAFSSAGETVTLGVLKDGSNIHFFVNGQYALSHSSQIEGAAVAGVFGFNTGMTLTEYFTDTSAETKRDMLSLVPNYETTNFFGRTDGYSSTSQIDLTDDTGAHTGTVTVDKSGTAFGYVNNFSEDNFYFEVKFDISEVNSGENYPKFGLFVEAGNISELFYVDMSSSLYSDRVGRATRTNGNYDWNDATSKKIDTRYFSDVWETITLGVLKDGSDIHFFADGQYLLSYTSNIQGNAMAGIFGFNTGMTLTEYYTDLSAETKEAKLELVIKPYESQIQGQIDALYQEYIAEHGCEGKGGTLILGDFNIELWDTWDSQLGLTNYVDGYNVGIADSTTQDWLDAYDKLIAPFEADRIVIMVGANDVNTWSESGETAAKNLKTLFEKIHADNSDANIYYVYAIPSPSVYANGAYTNTELGELISHTKDLCASYEYVFGIDVFDLLVTADRQNSNTDLFDADKTHMNQAGYAVYADHLYEMIFGDDSVSSDQIAETDKFVLYDGNMSAPILMDAQYNTSQAYTQVKRAVGDLRQDVAMVNGAIDYRVIQQTFMDSDAHQAERLANAKKNKVPALIHNVPDGITYNYAVIIGTIGESAIVDQIITAGKLPEAETIKGNWEAYVIKEVANPIPGVKNALVIAGSDARGTIYGIYTISEKIGVSPYYWYSDVAVRIQDTIALDYEVALVDDGPDVQYRGIFINDEEFAASWAKLKFNEEAPGTNYYRRVFEMLLRLKANTLWPGMKLCSSAFTRELDSDGIPVNSKEADKYGIIMSASHCDILLRFNWLEWDAFLNANPGKYPNRAYDFTINEQALLDYWGQRLETVKKFESILPVGIRGIQDLAMECVDLDKYPGATEEEKKVNMVIDVITKQRELIYTIYGTEPQNVPQVYIAYKEANDLYNAGVNEFLAWDGSQDFNGDGVIDWRDDNSDIILMYAEDNQNYLRQTLSEIDAQRSGGGGIYYHISYCGQPRSVLVTNDVQLSVMVEQMRRAYDTGTDRYWILNVGDIKPGEIATELFMKQAWDTETYTDATIESKFLTELAERDFHLNKEDAKTFAALMSEYYQLTGIKRQAFFYINNGDTFEFNNSAYNDATIMFNAWANGDEAMRFVNRCNDMMDALDQLYKNLPEEDKTSFYQMAYFMADLLRDSAVEHLSYWKNQLAASQGRFGSSKKYAELGLAASTRISESVKRYNSQNNNKWMHMMDLHPVSVSYEQISADRYTILHAPSEGVGAACENQQTAGSGVLRFNSASADDQRYFDVFDKNSVAEKWMAEVSAEWIVLSSYSGEVTDEHRVLVSVDWSKLNADADGTITVYNVDEYGNQTDAVATFDVQAVMFEGYGDNTGYVAANGYAAIEAEHYSQKVDGNDGSYWAKVVSNGQYGDSMKTMPSGDFHTEDWQNTARLYYSVYFEEAGTYTLTLNRRPSLNEGKTLDGREKSMNVAVGIGSAEPAILVGTRICNERDDVWRTNVLRQVESLACEITVEQGWNDIVLYCVDADFVVDRMIVRTIEGAAPVGLLGPCESPNNVPGANTKPLCPATLPNNADYCVVLEYLQVNTTISANLTGITNALAEDRNIIDVKVLDGIVEITGKRAGVAVVRVRFEDGQEGCVIAVVRTDADGNGAYNEEDGCVVINAADAMANGMSAYTIPTNDGIYTWEYYRGGISVQPDSGSMWTSTSLSDLKGIAPSITYSLMINNPGEYYLYVNTSVPNNAADSYHVFVDDEYWHSVNDSQLLNYGWYSAGKSIDLTAGLHKISIYAREDGLAINQLVLSTNGSRYLTGLQPPSALVAFNDQISCNDLTDVSLIVGGAYREVGIFAKALSEITVQLQVDNSNESVVTAVLTDNRLKLTAQKTGQATITVTASAEGYESVVRSFTVTVEAASDGEIAYIPNSDGAILIHAADAMQQMSFAEHNNTNSSTEYSDVEFTWTAIYEENEIGTGIQLTPVATLSNNICFTATDPTGNPGLTFKVWVPDAGEYYLYGFSNSPNNTSDSFYFGINGEKVFASQNVITNKSGGSFDAVGENWFCYDKQAVTLDAGYNTIQIWARESGLLLRQIMLAPAKQSNLADWMSNGSMGSPSTINLQDISDMIMNEDDEAGTVELVASSGNGNTVSFYAESSNENIAQVSLEGSVLSVTPVAMGKATVTVTANAVGCGLARVTFNVTVMKDVLHYKADGQAFEDGVTVEAYSGTGTFWDHAGSTYKTYIGSSDGAFVGDFVVSIKYNTKAQKTVSGNDGYTTRLYVTDYSDTTAWWSFNPPWTSINKSNNAVLGSPTQTVSSTIPSKEAAIDIFKNCDVELTVTRDGNKVTLDISAIAGEGTGYEGQTFTTQCIMDGVTSEILQLALCNRAFSQYTTKDIKICGNLYDPNIREGAWQEKNGKVVIPAAAAVEMSTHASYSSVNEYDTWVKYTDGRFEGIMQNSTAGTIWSNVDSVFYHAPQVHYTFHVTNPGRYYLYLFTSYPDTAANSVYAFMDDDRTVITCATSSYQEGLWVSDEGWYFDIEEAGEHTITICAREDGVILNQIMLSKNSAEIVTNGVEQPVSARNTYEIHGIFKEENGDLTIDLATAFENSEYAYATVGSAEGIETPYCWERSTGLNGVQVYPDTGVQWATNKISPKLSYQIEFTTPGDYYVMLYTSYKDAAADSVYVSVDDGDIMACINELARGPGKWMGNVAWKITISEAGVHTINVYPREDGAILHKLRLTQNLVSVETLVTGDSYTSKTYWKDLDEQLAPIGGQTIGVSGSEVDAWTTYAETLKVYDPKNVVVHIGVNDINRGQSGTECGNEIVTLLEKYQSIFPNAKIFYIAICDNTSHPNEWDEYAASNAIVKAYIDSADNMYYIDYAAVMKAEADNMTNQGFSDGLHPNSEGYALLSQLVCDTVLEVNKTEE